jgi:hypothetical protein
MWNWRDGEPAWLARFNLDWQAGWWPRYALALVWAWIRARAAGGMVQDGTGGVHPGATAGWSPAAEVAAAPHSDEYAPDFDVNTWQVDLHGGLNRLLDDFQHDLDMVCDWVHGQLGTDARTLLRYGLAEHLFEPSGEYQLVAV